MICFFCHRPIRGVELQDRYEWRLSPDRPGRAAVYGKGELPLGKAYGRLLKLSHGKCFHAFRKQEQLAAAKAADPSSQLRPDSDWRDQDVREVEELTQGHEGDGDNRGA